MSNKSTIDSPLRQRWEALRYDAPDDPKSTPTQEQLPALQAHKARVKEFLASLSPEQRAELKRETKKPKSEEHQTPPKPVSARPTPKKPRKPNRGKQVPGTQIDRHINEILELPCRELHEGPAYYPFTRCSPAPRLPAEDDAPRSDGTALRTAELDSFEAGARLAATGLRPAVLNMANEYNCGGGWDHCLGSQEESLFRSSTLPLSLWPVRRSDDTRLGRYDKIWPRAEEAVYPWTEAAVMYTSRVLILGPVDRRIAEDKRREVAVVSCAAQDLRSERKHYAGPYNPDLTREKIRSIFWAAAHHGHDAVVLGGFGCGAFRNDPDVIAGAFAELLGPGGEFYGRFGVIVFAIIKSRSNLEAFSRRFPLCGPDLEGVVAGIR